MFKIIVVNGLLNPCSSIESCNKCLITNTKVCKEACKYFFSLIYGLKFYVISQSQLSELRHIFYSILFKV